MVTCKTEPNLTGRSLRGHSRCARSQIQRTLMACPPEPIDLLVDQPDYRK